MTATLGFLSKRLPISNITRASPKGPVVSLVGPFRNDIDGKFQRTIKDQKPSRAERPLVLEAL